jgi:phenylalanyl-tRNA synthetase beta subunit
MTDHVHFDSDVDIRHLHRNLDNEEVNELHSKVTERLVKDLDVELR